MHDSGGFKPGLILGTCSGEMGGKFLGDGETLTPLGREAVSGPRFPRGGPQEPSIFSSGQGLLQKGPVLCLHKLSLMQVG